MCPGQILAVTLLSCCFVSVRDAVVGLGNNYWIWEGRCSGHKFVDTSYIVAIEVCSVAYMMSGYNVMVCHT